MVWERYVSLDIILIEVDVVPFPFTLVHFASPLVTVRSWNMTKLM